MIKKKPWLAAVLNLIPGLGYIYNGKRQLFGGLLLVAIVIIIADGFYLAYTNSLPESKITLSSVSGLLITVAFMYDAYKEAKHLNQR